ncbi:hypothetical protein VF21_02435 [Pseudogymnoascus sp. 05NY08]|nr:hypothetical protein VF21_02435 [Pseudogymnoascus sp. 05NY08]
MQVLGESIAELKAEATASTKTRDVVKNITVAIGVANSKYVLDLESTNTGLRTAVSTMTADILLTRTPN